MSLPWPRRWPTHPSHAGPRWFRVRWLERRNTASPGYAGPQWVCVYDVDRAYGGPEEGGWWYDTGVLVRQQRVGSRRAAQRLMRRWRREIARARRPDHHDRFSVLSDGDLEVFCCRGYPAQLFPARRPHYE